MDVLLHHKCVFNMRWFSVGVIIRNNTDEKQKKTCEVSTSNKFQHLTYSRPLDLKECLPTLLLIQYDATLTQASIRVAM